jgi:UDP-3-O-[3-hydroxymyristoyl] glucosamine N-acyltransferase
MVKIKHLIDWVEKNNLKYFLSDNLSIDKIINKPWNIKEANEDNITFINSGWIDNEASVVFCDKKQNVSNKLLIISDNPKYDFVKCVSNFFKPEKAKIILGKNTFIGENCSIGNDGFGYIQDENKKWIKFPHYGDVVIGDDVEIGNNVCIDRGTLSNTIIGNGVKIDNLVHIAHNVEIGENTLIIAQTMIGGSSKIGKDCWISPSTSIKNGINIGDNVLIGMGAVVLKDVENNKVMVGNPAKELIKK